MTVNYILTEVFMGLGHAGLNELIEKHARKNIGFRRAMESGELVLFLNKKRDKLKLFGYNREVLGYLKIPAGKKLSLETVNLVPTAFGGSLSYGKAVRAALSAFTIHEPQTQVQEQRVSA